MFFATGALAVWVTTGTSHGDEVTSHDISLVNEFGEPREEKTLFFAKSGSGFHGDLLVQTDMYIVYHFPNKKSRVFLSRIHFFSD
jgi:hypothetical protein